MIEICCRVACVAVFLCCAPLPWRLAPAAAAQQASEAPASEAPPFVGCGKAQAMGWPGVDDMGTPTSVALEAMNETDVLHYDLDIELSDLNPAANSCTITGQNRMTIRSKSAALSTFTLRLRSQYDVTSALANDLHPVTVSTDSTTSRTVTLDRTYGMDEMFTLTIVYTGTSESAGLASIAVATHSGTPVAFTHSEPYYAYTWWPTKDGDLGQPGDNSDKATLDISVIAPSNFVVPSIGLLQSVETLTGNRTRYNWSSGNPIATYLVSFAATNYTSWTKDYVHAGGTMPVEFFIYPELDTPSNRLSWERVTDMLDVFGSLFGEYPFIDEKYGIYNFPLGGMEHQTMTGQCCFDERLSAHELAHQWWGDAVTCETWSDIWLNEGFAKYAECLWEEFKTGSSDPAAYFSAIIARKPSRVDGSVYVYPPDTANRARIFNFDFSYLKAAWVLHQLRHVVGDATFFQILADYRGAFEGSAATTDEFVAVASATYGQDLTWFFDQWVYAIGAPTYLFGWATTNVAGQQYLHLKIQQVQSPSYPWVFVMPVDVEVTRGAIVETLTVWNDARYQWFVLPVAGPPTQVRFDPRQWVLRIALGVNPLRLGDFDADQNVDATDYGFFAACFTGACSSDTGGQVAVGCEPGDFEGDGDIDCIDWEQFTTAWTAFGAPPELPPCSDCNASGGPDECEIIACIGELVCADCNTNAVLDVCDITAGVSSDADANGIPDECETGACCDGNTGACAVGVSMALCGGPLHVWRVNASCAELDPPCAGACCDLLTGICTESAPSLACSGPHRTWAGAAACNGVICQAVTGACCDHDPFTGCTDGVTRAECDCGQCEWIKDGLCADMACTRDTIPTVSTWGLVALSLLLLTGAKIRFGRGTAELTCKDR